MFPERALERTIDALRGDAAIPLRVELWNGQRFDLARNPAVTIGIPTVSALRYFIAPDLNKLGGAFVEGHIRVERAFGFANGWMNVYQVLAGKAANYAAQSLPMTREYMYAPDGAIPGRP